MVALYIGIGPKNPYGRSLILVCIFQGNKPLLLVYLYKFAKSF